MCFTCRCPPYEWSRRPLVALATSSSLVYVIIVFSINILHYTYMFMPPRSKIGSLLFLYCLSFFNSFILPFCHSVIILFPLWNINPVYNFWRVSARPLIFHMNIPCGKTFPWVPLFLTLWPWPIFFL